MCELPGVGGPLNIFQFPAISTGGSYGRRSYAPISQREPCGRFTPRWSRVTGHCAFGIAFSAGLPVRSAIVCVGPPFALSWPIFGASPVLSVPIAANVHPSVLATRLRPAEATLWLQFGPDGAVFSPSSVARSVVVPPST